MVALETLKNSRCRVQQLKDGVWEKIEVQHHLLRGYVAMLVTVKVVVYGHDSRGRVVVQGEPYGNGDHVLYVLQGKTMEHYIDCY